MRGLRVKALAGLMALLPGFSFPGMARDAGSGHRTPAPGEIAVSKPGSYAVAGTTYILVNDISSPKSAIFLGKDVTLNLNGYILTYADGGYEHIPNYSFEEGLDGWDISGAPGARVEDTRVHVFVGDKILRLPAGEEIVSPYIYLPVPDRSYFAICGVIAREMRVSVYVEDEKGTRVNCITAYTDSTMVSCPVEKRFPRLGGGFVFAHIPEATAGRYRIRVKAETDCLIDHVDLRPAMDVGIGIVERTHHMGHNDHLYNRVHSAFFDYTGDLSTGAPIPGIPVVEGKGTVTIKNGTIMNGTTGVLSWGIQSTAGDVTVILDSVKILTSGINTSAVDVPQAIITNCYFDVKSPFIINRHGAEFYAVDLTGESASEVSFSRFFGGQGCLSFKGDLTSVHHNFFANRQTVTNHYSIMAMGDSSRIFDNLIRPETGSGIEIYVHRGIEIFNNEIYTMAAPPTCEYGHEEYSTNAVRIADYGARPGDALGCFGNKIYNNRIYITGRDYSEYPDYIPMAYAVFYSAGAGDNYIYGNDIVVDDQSPGSKNETSAFYIGGSVTGGQFYDNTITANVPALWVASRYGGASDTKICNNTIIRSATAGEDFKPVRMGWEGHPGCVAKNIQFCSNRVIGAGFEIDATAQAHSYTVSWTLEVEVTDRKGETVSGQQVRILDRSGNEVANRLTGLHGSVVVELPGYRVNGVSITHLSPYTVIVNKKQKKVSLDTNREITIKTS